ncbi:MAG TPA: lysylphosphatidylglycerol synthase domain-containing protein, partial [Terriglobus sp.]
TFHGSMLASILSNLSFLLPSAPGGIGPFEASAKLAMESQGVATSVAILYALFVHSVVFMIVNVVGGIGFLLNRKEHGGKSLSEELETLPPEADVL